MAELRGLGTDVCRRKLSESGLGMRSLQVHGYPGSSVDKVDGYELHTRSKIEASGY
jgi:hypothetical protein